jgi:hypothetical protein
MAVQICSHKTCADCRLNGINGVAAVIFNNYFGKQWVIMAGKERAGMYKGLFNLIAGKMESCDNGCYIAGIRRESREEFKINVDQKADFDKIFLKNGKVRYFFSKKTIIFVGVVNGLSRGALNAEISKCNADRSLPWCEREMECVEWFNVSSLEQIEGKDGQVTSFVKQVIVEAFGRI